jgi:electron transfer flavoprotein alpha subunit
MSNVLIVAEHAGGKLKKITLSAITFGKQAADAAGGQLHLLVLGHDVSALADELVKYGAAKVHVAEAPVLEHALAEAYARVVADVAKSIGAGVVGAAASFLGKDYLPRVAARLGAGLASDVSGVGKGAAGLEFTRPVYAGNAIATCVIDTPVKVVSVRPTAFDAAAPAGSASPVEKVAVGFDTGALKTKFVSFNATKSARPDLADAQVVVSGGRGLKGPENFKLIEDLADLLGGACGATRAICDAGWVPNDLQVGQTGKVVAPQLYFAVGLSGAIQHLAGMKDSKVIVAINKDPEAPIFKVADYGLVEDLFKVMGPLIDEIKKVRA